MSPTAAEYAAALRQLADLIEANPDLDEPRYLRTAHVWCPTTVDEVRAIGFAAVRAGMTVTKRYYGDSMSLDIVISPGITVQALAARSAVCERVLVGTETVVEQEPDPDAPLVTIPDPTATKPVARTVEKYEWRCGPTERLAEATR